MSKQSTQGSNVYNTLLEMEDEVPIEYLHNLANEPGSRSIFKKEEVDGAAKDFIKNAGKKIVAAFASLGEKLAKISGRDVTTEEEKIPLLFETVAKCADKDIKDPIAKKFVNSIKGFIEKFIEKTQSVAPGSAKSGGGFADKILDERKNLSSKKGYGGIS
jgi:CRISPR/Cas system CSM-associated protein Csm2 small subunit